MTTKNLKYWCGPATQTSVPATQTSVPATQKTLMTDKRCVGSKRSILCSKKFRQSTSLSPTLLRFFPSLFHSGEITIAGSRPNQNNDLTVPGDTALTAADLNVVTTSTESDDELKAKEEQILDLKKELAAKNGEIGELRHTIRGLRHTSIAQSRTIAELSEWRHTIRGLRQTSIAQSRTITELRESHSAQNAATPQLEARMLQLENSMAEFAVNHLANNG